jgi:hypothetical protein
VPPDSSSIFISNLPWAVDNDVLGSFLSDEIGGVTRVSVMMRDGRSRGMAIADFERPELAQSAVQVRCGRPDARAAGAAAACARRARLVCDWVLGRVWLRVRFLPWRVVRFVPTALRAPSDARGPPQC